MIPNGVELPADNWSEASPPEVLFAGRLSPEKGIDELLAASAGLNLVVAGDGPLRSRVPQARGFVSRSELESLYRRAAVVTCPSRREGFGMVCAEAMAYGKPVVASAVGGLLDLVEHERTGLVGPACWCRPGIHEQSGRHSTGCSPTESSAAGSARPGDSAWPICVRGRT